MKAIYETGHNGDFRMLIVDGVEYRRRSLIAAAFEAAYHEFTRTTKTVERNDTPRGDGYVPSHSESDFSSRTEGEITERGLSILSAGNEPDTLVRLGAITPEEAAHHTADIERCAAIRALKKPGRWGDDTIGDAAYAVYNAVYAKELRFFEGEAPPESLRGHKLTDQPVRQ